MNFWVANSERDKWSREMGKGDGEISNGYSLKLWNSRKRVSDLLQRRNAQIGDGMGLWWLKSAMKCSNLWRLGFFWLISDGMLIGDGWLGLLATECSNRRQLGFFWLIGNGMLIGYGCLGYRWWNAHRQWLALVISGGKLKSVVECSNWRRLGFFWLIRDEMLIGDGCFGYRWRNAHWRCNAHRWRLASVTVGSFGLSASSDDGDGVGVLFGVQTLGSEMK